MIASFKSVARLTYGDALAHERRNPGAVPVFGSNGPFDMHDRANTLGPVIIVGRKGSCGKVAWSPVPTWCTDTAFHLDQRGTKHNLRWIYWALQTLNLDSMSQDTGVPGLSREVAYSLKLRVPGLAEQAAIANYLDTKTTAIDALIAKKEELLGLLDRYQQAVISDAVTGKSPTAKTRLKFAFDGVFGGIWGDEPTGGLHDLVVVRVADFNRSACSVELGSTPTIRQIPRSALNNRELKKGDLLLEKSGGGELTSVGNVVVFNDSRPAVCSNFVARLPVRPEHCPWFLAYVFRALYQSGKNLPHIKQTSGIQNLDTSSYLDEKVWLPPLSVQREIANELAHKCREISRLAAKAEEQIRALAEFRSSVISAAVTGKLDIPTP